MFPPLPSWDTLHPLIVHFPIGVLIVAPVLAVLGLFVRRYSRCFSVAALVLMFLGTVAAWFAVATGEAAAQLAERTPEITATIERHQDLAEWARTIFTILTAVYATLLLVPPVMKKPLAAKIDVVAQVVFLIFYGATCLLLANAAHLGGLLVHKYDVRSMFP